MKAIKLPEMQPDNEEQVEHELADMMQFLHPHWRYYEFGFRVREALRCAYMVGFNSGKNWKEKV